MEDDSATMSLVKSREPSETKQAGFSLPGSVKRANGRIASAAIEIDDDFTLIAPVFVPDLADVRAFAEQIHKQGKAWRGIAFGWSAHYEPKSGRVPAGSKALFDPASFCVGDATAWCYCATWEDGDDLPPLEYIADKLTHETDNQPNFFWFNADDQSIG
jgi:hypothetical protein